MPRAARPQRPRGVADDVWLACEDFDCLHRCGAKPQGDQVLPADRIVLVKVRLADLFDVKDGLERGPRQTALNRITRKHLDFVVCNRAACVPVLAIELDDASHSRADRQTRDLFVDGLCRAAGLPLVCQPAQRGYTLEEVRAALATGSAGSSSAAASA